MVQPVVKVKAKGCDNGQVDFNFNRSWHAAHKFGVVFRWELNKDDILAIRQQFEDVMGKLTMIEEESNQTITQGNPLILSNLTIPLMGSNLTTPVVRSNLTISRGKSTLTLLLREAPDHP